MHSDQIRKYGIFDKTRLVCLNSLSNDREYISLLRFRELGAEVLF